MKTWNYGILAPAQMNAERKTTSYTEMNMITVKTLKYYRKS